MIFFPRAEEPEEKKKQVEQMFSRIAFRYDLLNQLLSFGIHKQWRRKAIRLLQSEIHNPQSELLDVATGTGDFAIEAVKLNPRKIIGIDLAEEMLKRGREKLGKKNLSSTIRLLKGDAENIPFPNGYFDAATVGFGVRNFVNLEKALREIFRVLKPGGILAILEFSLPEKFPVKQLYGFYLKYCCPLLGKIISGDAEAYSYLERSVRAFPSGEGFCEMLLQSGFSDVKFFPLTFGIVTIYAGAKKNNSFFFPS